MQLLPQSVVIASRVLSFEWPDGASLDVAVEVYRPEEVDARSWACTFVVRGFESDIVRPIFGIDSMQALVLSLQPANRLFGFPGILLPTDPTFGTFSTAWRQGNLGTYLLNSAVVAVLITAAQITTSVLAAYAFVIGA